MSFVLSSPGANLTQQVAASVISPISVDAYKFYSSYGYATTPGTTPQGTVVWEGTLTSVTRRSDDDLQVQIDLPAPVDDLSFGSIAIYTSSGELFALHVYQHPVQLYAKTLDTSTAFRVRGKIHVPAGETTVLKMGSPFITPTTYAPAAVLPAPAVGTRVQVSSSNAPTLSLEGLSSTQWEVLGHKSLYGIPQTPSVVSSISGDTTATVPGSVFDQLNSFSVGRYVIQGPAGQIARVKSLTVAGANVVLRLDGSYAWVTTSADLTAWENFDLTFVTHLLTSLDSAHSQYMTVAEGTALFAPVSHVSAADPHTDFILKTAATGGGLSLTPLGHVLAADPHTQYQLKTAAAAAFLPGTVNSLVQDSVGTPRFIWSRQPSLLPSFTEVRGTPNLSNPRTSSFEMWGTGLSPLLYAMASGAMILPGSALPLTDESSSAAVNSWAQARIRDPQRRRLRDVTGTSAPALSLTAQDGYHVYSAQNKATLDLPTIMDPAGTYEVLYSAVCRIAPLGVNLLVNSADAGVIYSCQRADIVAEGPWTQSTYFSSGGSNNLTVQAGTMWTLNFDENHNANEGAFAYKNFETANASVVDLVVDFRSRNSLGRNQAILRAGCSQAGVGVEVRYENGTLQILKATSWSHFGFAAAVSPASQAVSFDVTQWTTMTVRLTATSGGVVTVTARLNVKSSGAAIGATISTTVTGSIGDYAGFVNGHPDDAPSVYTTDYDNLSVTTPHVYNRLTAPFKNTSSGTVVAGRFVLTPATKTAFLTAGAGDDFCAATAVTIGGSTPWTTVGRLGTTASVTDSVESGYSWWAAVRRIS